jgi:hypothetical protein
MPGPAIYKKSILAQPCTIASVRIIKLPCCAYRDGAEEVIAVFAGQGLNLQRGGEVPGSVFQKELNGVKPQMYSLNGVDLPLYQFSSAEERAAGWKDFGEQTAAADLIPYKAYQEDRFLMFYIHGGSAAEGIKFNEKLDKQLKAAIQGLITAE